MKWQWQGNHNVPSLMTAEERDQFLPVVRTFTGILEEGNADPNETKELLEQIRKLNELIPANMRANIEQITGLTTSNFVAPTPVRTTKPAPSPIGKYNTVW